MRSTAVVVLVGCLCSFSAADWESVGPYGGSLYKVAVAPSNENIIYVTSAASQAAVFKSTNAGAAWSRAGSIPAYVYCLAVDPVNPNVLYAGSNSRVYKSTDGGAGWTSYPVSINVVYGLAVHPTNPARVFAVSQTTWAGRSVMGFFRSTDGGVNWSGLVLDSLEGEANSVALDPSDPNRMYVGGYSTEPKVFKSTDGGSSFADVSEGMSTGVYLYALAVHPTNPDIVYAGLAKGGIYRSTTGGNNWTIVLDNSFIASLATTRSLPSVVYAGSDTCVLKSTDTGASWFFAGSGIWGLGVTGLAASQNQPSVVYSTDNAGFFRTTNGGSNWLESNTGINLAAIGTLAVSRSAPSTIYVEHTSVGVFKTTNSGTNWLKLPSFLSCGNICALAIHNADPSTCLALEGSG